MQVISAICKDFVASNMRSQVKKLNAILSSLEDEDSLDVDYLDKSLKEIEINLRQIRKLCTDN